MRVNTLCRRGALALEYALVLPVFLFLVLALIVGGLGVYRANEVGWLAQECARWASVHGGEYSEDTGLPAATPADVYQNVILAEATLLDLSALGYSVTWDDPGKMPTYLDANNYARTNRVTVTITYRWVPEMFLGGVTLRNTAQREVSY
jgi:Flp pilus assembly protein TadG